MGYRTELRTSGATRSRASRFTSGERRSAAVWLTATSEKGLRFAQNMRVGPCIPVEILL
jgi:hypothetical protein